ncbi:MAG: S8 family serine peptidase, partial [Anaerolineae bacterium]
MNMKNNLFNLILILSLILAAWPGSTKAQATPPPLAARPSRTTVQLSEQNLKEQDQDWQTWKALPAAVKAKVDPRLLDELQGKITPAHLNIRPEHAPPAPPHDAPDKTRFLVHLKVQADLQPLGQRTFSSRTARRNAVLNALLSTAQATQGPVKALLETKMSRGDVASYQPFYVFNGLAVEGNLSTLIALAQRDDVERIVANYPLVGHENSGRPSTAPAQDLGGLHPDNWNIDLVDAERVWNEFGVTGQGTVVANIDSGVDYTHPSLVNQYRGNLGHGDFVHDYNWFDPDPELYPGGDLGPSRTIAPSDYGGHGTHTMGTMVGDGGDSGTQVGMAPGAKWIAISLNEMSAVGSIADDIMGHKAFQWMLCPTDLSGALATADCSQAPDAVNNSWGSANPADDTFRPDLQALRAAGVAPVFSSGNPSAGLGSIGSPGSNPEAITVGATDSADEVASFSGRGPSFYEGEQKPELSAPGVGVKSSVPWGYDYYSGTSMAAPHVAGLIALMISADLQDGVRHLDVDELEHFMASTAADLGAPGPDDDYGYGRIDAYDAVRWARSAGDLRGMVYDATTSGPIAGTTVSGFETHRGDIFGGQANTSGQYAVTVPAGDYDVTVETWGYYSDTFSHQLVITGALSIADFSLNALPSVTLTGRVRSGFTPISGALVYVAAQPSVSFVTGSNGDYALALPVGAHEIVVQAPGHRILREQVSVSSGPLTYDPFLTSAPTILLVGADAYAGWFRGWPVHNYFQWAMDERDYLYDVWPIQDSAFDDTQVMPDGSIRYGIPSTTTLGAYDLVLWAYGSNGYSLTYIGADDELMAYLDHGGRLIISGQDLGWSDGYPFYADYLHADHVLGTATDEGETVSGHDSGCPQNMV